MLFWNGKVRAIDMVSPIKRNTFIFVRGINQSKGEGKNNDSQESKKTVPAREGLP
jgi:hypothetical protein